MSQIQASIQQRKILQALARHWSFPNPSLNLFNPEDIANGLIEEFESGSFTQKDIDTMVEVASDLCLDTYEWVHKGKKPVIQ